MLTTLLAYCQLVLGSQLRHVLAGGRAGRCFARRWCFTCASAAALVVHIVLLAVAVVRTQRGQRSLLCVRPSRWPRC